MEAHRQTWVKDVTPQEAFFQEVKCESERQAPQEPVVAAFNEALPEAYKTIPAYKELLEDYLTDEPNPYTSYKATKWFRAHQFLLLEPQARKATGYPTGFDQPESWLEWLKEHFNDSRLPLYQRLQEALQRRLQVNRYERANVAALGLMAIEQDERSGFLLQPAKVQEYGSAGDIILKALLARKFSSVTVFDRDGTPNQAATKLFNTATSLVTVGEGVGVEIAPPETEEDKRWLKSGTLSPSQLLDKGLDSDATRYELFEAMEPSGIRRIKGDMFKLKPEQQQALREPLGDLALFSHVLAQNRRHVSKIIKMTLGNIHRRGLILINEYADVDPTNPQKLLIHDRWYDEEWRCKTIAMDARKPDEGFFTILEWRRANCREVRFCEENLGRIMRSFA